MEIIFCPFSAEAVIICCKLGNVVVFPIFLWYNSFKIFTLQWAEGGNRMAAPQNFRTAFNGFHKEDVVRYLEYLNSKYNNQINQLTAEAAELRAQLEKPQEPDADQIALIEALQQERDDFAAKLEQSEKARAAAEQELAQLREEKAALAEVSQEPVSQETTLASDELEAYRRAERTEREAKERAELVYYQANGVLSEATAKVDHISGEITEMADHVMSQLTQLQMLVSSSKLALQDASSLLNTIRPNK
jgi:chromosome segregation ATPase